MKNEHLFFSLLIALLASAPFAVECQASEGTTGRGAANAGQPLMDAGFPQHLLGGGDLTLPLYGRKDAGGERIVVAANSAAAEKRTAPDAALALSLDPEGNRPTRGAPLLPEPVGGIPDPSFGAGYSVSSTTLLSLQNSNTPEFGKQRLMPATQFIQIDMHPSDNVSLHLYGWGRVDLGHKSTPTRNPDADFSYGYLEYRLPKGNGIVKAGRFTLFEGGAVERIDGVSAHADLPMEGVALSLFAGKPVRSGIIGNTGNSLLGGRLSYHKAGVLEVGVSLQREDGLHNGPDLDLKSYRAQAGVDLWVNPWSPLELSGHSNYNLATGNFTEHSYLLKYRATTSLLAAAEYNLNNLKDYFSASSIRSLFNPNLSEKIRSYGASLTYTVARPLEVTADYKNYKRDTRETSHRFGAELRLNLADSGTTYGFSLHRLYAGRPVAGTEPLPIVSFNEVRVFAMYRNLRYSASIDAMADVYDTPMDGMKSTYMLLASAGYSILPNLNLSGDLSYEATAQYGRDLKGLVRLVYNYSHFKEETGK